MEQLMSMSKIFSEKIFRIPDYQRGYAWAKNELEDFWGDLIRLEEKKNHYVGVLTLEPVKEKDYKKWIDDLWIIDAKRYIPYYVVDGQQRLTTSIILIYVIYQIMQEKNFEKLNYTTQEEISRKYIFEYQDESKNRTYMFGYERENPSYGYLITKIYDENIVLFGNDSETIYTNNLSMAKNFFYDKLKNLSYEELQDIYTKITQHFLFNMYIITDDIDVFVTFETMNNRGKLLSNLELLKNRLIYISTLFQVEDSEKCRLRRDINDCWKKIYHILGKSKERVLLDDEFLVTHFMLFFAKKERDFNRFRHSSQFSRFSEWQSKFLLNDYFVVKKIVEGSLTMKDCFEYIESLSECIDFWGDIKNPDSSSYDSEIKEYIDKINFNILNKKRILRFGDTPDFSYLNVFLLACFRACRKDTGKVLDFLKILERYLFLVDFYDEIQIHEANISLLKLPDLVLKLNKNEIDIKIVIDKLTKICETLINSSDLKENVISYYGKNGFYRIRGSWLRYFLYEYEVSLMKKSKANIQKLNCWDLIERGLNSIEHIYPENSHSKYWIELFKSYNSKEKDSLKNSLGNFVITSAEKNSRLGNKSFPEKKENTQNPVGYKYGSYAEIELTDYNDWNAEAILNRGLKLTVFLQERWGIKIGNGSKEDKKKFLGLQFLN